MLRRNLFVSLVLFTVMIFYLIFGTVIFNNKVEKRIQNGIPIVHLNSNNDVIDLTGEWLFNRNDDLSFANTNIDVSDWKNIKVPGLWNLQGYNHNGSSWFRHYFTIDNIANYSLVIPKVIAGYEVYINGVLIGGLGEINTDGSLKEEETHIHLIDIPTPLLVLNELNIIAIRVSTISADGGFVETPFKIGNRVKLNSFFQRYLLYYASMAAILLFVGVYFILLYNIDPTYKHNLLFGFTSILAALFIIGQKSLGYWITSNHWINLLVFIYIPISLVPYIMVKMIHSFFRKKVNHIVKFIMNLYLIIPLILLVVPFSVGLYIFFFERLVIGIYMMTILVFGYCMIISEYAINRKFPGSQVMSIGISICTITAIINALANSGLVVLYDPLAEGLLFLCLFMSSAASMEVSSVRKELLETNLSLQLHNKSLHRFVPFEFFSLLNKLDILEINAGDNKAIETTVLFTDIRSFTSMSEKMTPKENFEFINDYLEHMVPIINKHNGFIDKYIGDAIMAIFPGSPDNAVNAAISMQNELKNFNIKRELNSEVPIEMGVGIHYGKLMLGIIGNESRLEGTVISDTVNIASRIESLTKVFSSHILISNDLFLELNKINLFKYRFMGLMDIIGKDEPVSIFEIFNGDNLEIIEMKEKTKDEFENGILKFSSNKIEEAKISFKKVIEINADDKTALCFIEKIKIKEHDNTQIKNVSYYNDLVEDCILEEL